MKPSGRAVEGTSLVLDIREGIIRDQVILSAKPGEVGSGVVAFHMTSQNFGSRVMYLEAVAVEKFARQCLAASQESKGGL